MINPLGRFVVPICVNPDDCAAVFCRQLFCERHHLPPMAASCHGRRYCTAYESTEHRIFLLNTVRLWRRIPAPVPSSESCRHRLPHPPAHTWFLPAPLFPALAPSDIPPLSIGMAAVLFFINQKFCISFRNLRNIPPALLCESRNIPFAFPREPFRA